MRTWTQGWRGRVLLLVILGLALRVGYTIVVKGNDPPIGDGPYYRSVALSIAQGKGFIYNELPIIFDDPSARMETAHHPPGYVLYLAFWALFFGNATLPLRLVSCLLGALAIVAAAKAGKEIAGERTGLIAGGFVAFNPLIWVNDAQLHSESLYIAGFAFFLFTSIRLWRQPTARNALLCGVGAGLAVMTRAEANMYCLFLVAPLVLSLKQHSLRRRLELGAMAAAVVVAMMAPWIAYNLSRFDGIVLMSNSTGGVMPQANCEPTYYGEFIGYWTIGCWFSPEELPLTVNASKTGVVVDNRYCDCGPKDWHCISETCLLGDESAYGSYGTEKGLDYLKEHIDRFPYVLTVRLGRIWNLYDPLQGVRWDAESERHGYIESLTGLMVFWVQVPLWIWSIRILRRRGMPTIPFVAPAVVITIAAAIAGGISRFRISFDVMLCIAAAVTLDELLRRRDARRHAPDDDAAATIAA